jgi:capsular polysaccharide export protein
MFLNQNPQMLLSSAALLTTSAGIAKLSSVSVLLENSVQHVPFWKTSVAPAANSLVLAWGRKATARRAEVYANRHQLPLLRLEDGFLRSVGLGHQEEPLSVVLDDIGIYYDASQPSRLEQLIGIPLTPAESERAAALVALWQRARVSKYNHNRDYSGVLPASFVLVADQTYGDASIAFGQASATSFQQMLQQAKALFPQHTILLKVHPDVMAGKKQGHFDLAELQQQGVVLLAEDVHPASILPFASAVFCVTSQLGFEALLWQKPVFTFGMPFYAGWGLTTDALQMPRRRKPVDLLQLVYAALVRYPRYLDPETGKRCEAERLIDWLALQRQQQQRFPAELYAVGFSWWKKHLLRQFIRGSKLYFVKTPAQVPQGACWLSWGSRYPAAEGQIRVEDGFIRSVGLGVALQKPLSWVFDPVGIYYNSATPSLLEQILLQTDFSASQLQQAVELQQMLLQSQITKYNLGKSSWQRPAGKKVLLVPGQVETDASIRLGSPQIQTNLQLLAQVRQQNPQAWLVYKPHPDVQAGLRKVGQTEDQALQFCDEIVLAEDMAHLLTQVDEVHTMTSLTGFEALLRGVPVFCYGQPFYAGWGLTRDWLPVRRRQRQLSLAQLIAGALLVYPVYFHPQSKGYATASAIVECLAAQRKQATGQQIWWRRLLEWYLRLSPF